VSLEIRQEELGDQRLLALVGRLDTETSADLELAIADLQAAGANKFLIDLAEVGYVSSAGLRVLLATAKQLEGGRGSLKLCCLNDSVRQVFDVAGFTRLFAIFATRAAALGSVDKTPAKPRESGLAKTAATLLGAKPTDAASSGDPDAAALARAASELLGDKSAAAKPAPAPKAKPPAAKPAAAPAAPASESSGVLGKFRGLFGKK
jgi:anti-anti-sigma factor